MESNKAIREETIKHLEKGFSEKEAESMAFLTVFGKSDEDEQVALAPMYNSLTEKHNISEKEWRNFEDIVRTGDRSNLDPYGYGIDMTSPLGKMIS